jgi:hypothetical protein
VQILVEPGVVIVQILVEPRVVIVQILVALPHAVIVQILFELQAVILQILDFFNVLFLIKTSDYNISSFKLLFLS